MLSRVKLTNAHTVRGRPTLKNNTECFRNGLVRELKEKQRKLSRHSMTSKTHGPHRRNDKSEYQECTCKINKSLNRGMFNKFESCKICVAGYQCDNSDFELHCGIQRGGGHGGLRYCGIALFFMRYFGNFNFNVRCCGII